MTILPLLTEDFWLVRGTTILCVKKAVVKAVVPSGCRYLDGDPGVVMPSICGSPLRPAAPAGRSARGRRTRNAARTATAGNGRTRIAGSDLSCVASGRRPFGILLESKHSN